MADDRLLNSMANRMDQFRSQISARPSQNLFNLQEFAREPVSLLAESLVPPAIPFAGPRVQKFVKESFAGSPRTKQFERENPKTALATRIAALVGFGKPTRIPAVPNSFGRFFQLPFSVKTKAGKLTPNMVLTAEEITPGVAQIGFLGSSKPSLSRFDARMLAPESGSLGQAGLKEVFRKFADEFPELRRLIGFRVGGRAGKLAVGGQRSRRAVNLDAIREGKSLKEAFEVFK